MKDALRAAARAAEGAGRLHGADVCTGRAEQPVCGDELELDLRIADGQLAELAWRARGCPATLAVAGCLKAAWHGTAIAEARARLAARVAQLGGLAPHEGHALELALRALDDARRTSS